MSSDVEISGNPWDDLYFTPDHPDADQWRAEIEAEMAAGYPDSPNSTVLVASIDQGESEMTTQAKQVQDEGQQARAVAAGLIDTLLRIAAYGLDDSRRDELRQYALVARDALVTVDPTAAEHACCHHAKAANFVCAERERELLELKGPCSGAAGQKCRLHYAHSGPCDIRPTQPA